jgi:hypothetical protein
MIELFNVKPGDLIDHEILLLFGKCNNYFKPCIEITDQKGNPVNCTIKNSYFKVIFFS